MSCENRTAAYALPAGTSPLTRSHTRMVVASTTSHTLTAVRRAALDAGAEVVKDGDLLEVTTDDRDGLLRALDATLTRPEKAEGRALDVDDLADTSLVARALTAPSIAVQCARLREQPLGAALQNSGTFHSVYQPIVDLGTGQSVAFEALLRGTVDGEPVMPGPMFAAAEEAGWLHVLDRVGRERAITGAGGWLGDADLFVNFNPTSIYRPEVCLATTERAIANAGLRMDQLVFEIVESYHIDSMDHLLGVLGHYRAMGCRIAMDDIGSGYASLNSLALISPDVVKLDKELVQGLPDRAAAAVVRSIVALSHDIGAIVIAECVETAEQIVAARDLGVDWAQGWFFARPSERPRDVATAPVPSGDHAPAASVADWAPTGRQLDILLRRAVSASQTGITLADARLPGLPMVYVNEAFSTITGFSPEEILGRNCRILQGEGTDPAAVARIRRALVDGDPVHERVRNIRPDGTPWWNDLTITPVRDVDGEVSHFIGIQQDVTALVEAEECSSFLATHDVLTGLANRSRLMDFLDAALQGSKRSGDVVAVTLIDVDGFRVVNDTHGHAVGDGLLGAIASRLSVRVRAEELLARMGGDQFVLVQVAPADEVDGATRRIDRDVHAAFEEPFPVGDAMLSVAATAGVARSRHDDVDAGRLIDRADGAVYTKKSLLMPSAGF